ncbi:Uncharacterised protein [Klebsiella pneumoniae]|uniref:Uncharacterized protein n=1 Tax=Klebsiella pneumoniae TaxID=573 RepID=A0A2X3I2T6_KLEPN|nr:Uncharacterised protein [Klebsiella pneumoniae]
MSRFIDFYVEQAVIGGIMLAAGRADGADIATDAIEGRLRTTSQQRPIKWLCGHISDSTNPVRR